jgi:DNA-binding NarL/FixJ family response regulator
MSMGNAGLAGIGGEEVHEATAAARMAGVKRLAVIVDQSLAAHFLRRVIRHASGLEAVGFFDGRQGFRPRSLTLWPDVVLVDDMQDQEHTLARLRETAVGLPVVQRYALTTRLHEPWLTNLFDAGADAVLSRDVEPLVLGTLLREAARCNIVHRPRAKSVDGSRAALTAREAQILRLAARGLTNGAIARELWITEQTVKFHLSNIYRKLGVSNRTEASWYAQVY